MSNAQFKVDSVHLNFDTQYERKASDYGRHIVTKLSVQSEHRLEITSDLVKTRDGFTHSITAQHPTLNGVCSHDAKSHTVEYLFIGNIVDDYVSETCLLNYQVKL